jgi:hypothetical protein
LSLARFQPDNPDVAGPSEGRASSAPHVRVSDAEREAALARLRDGFADGRLTHETFSHRVDEALRARADHELGRLVADLPTSRRLRAVALATCRRVLQATDRWLRGWPPVLTLPAGSQLRFTIGREPDCDMTLADETVSRWHASLERTAAGCSPISARRTARGSTAGASPAGSRHGLATWCPSARPPTSCPSGPADGARGRARR